MNLQISDKESKLFKKYNLDKLPKKVQSLILNHKHSLMGLRYTEPVEICETFINEDFKILIKKDIGKYLQTALAKCIGGRLKTIEHYL